LCVYRGKGYINRLVELYMYIEPGRQLAHEAPAARAQARPRTSGSPLALCRRTRKYRWAARLGCNGARWAPGVRQRQPRALLEDTGLQSRPTTDGSTETPTTDAHARMYRTRAAAGIGSACGPGASPTPGPRGRLAMHLPGCVVGAARSCMFACVFIAGHIEVPCVAVCCMWRFAAGCVWALAHSHVGLSPSHCRAGTHRLFFWGKEPGERAPDPLWPFWARPRVAGVPSFARFFLCN
jgi:hypothetical protein